MKMETIKYVQQPINLKVVKYELNISPPRALNPTTVRKGRKLRIPEVKHSRRESFVPSPPPIKSCSRKRDVLELVEELLDELYSNHPDWNSSTGDDYTQRSVSAASLASQSTSREFADTIERSYLECLDINDLREQLDQWNGRLKENGDRLARCVRARDRLRRQQKRLCAAVTVLLRHITGERGGRFGLRPGGGAAGEGGYAEWLHAMRLVARLPAGVPQHFRKKLWSTLADRHLSARGVDWPAAERACFRGTAQPDDAELGAQILKDLHRTGCSLFCGAEGRENQAMLRRVLLAYARWNKEVGYCQGFNMLAAIILEVMDKSESDSLKVMIYLVEAVLPEGYFADDLRGLSADMAAFRDLLRLRLPRLAHHMDQLQRASDGGGVEPPLPDVFTMQWFLTLYATWLPRESLLRIWDLVLLDGNEVLLLTALAIWDLLQERILSARTADEYYSCMGGGVRAVWEAGDALVARVVALGSVPELPRLRSLHRYRVAPPEAPTQPPLYQPPLHTAMQTMTKKGLRLFYSEDEGDSSDDGNKLALATMIPRRDDRLAAGDRLSLDIGALKRQYARLRERQRQAHVILAAACARHAAVGVSTSPTSLTVNNLLLGKSAIVSSRGRRLGPPPGSVPPTRQTDTKVKSEHHNRGKRNDTISWKEEQNLKSLSRRNSVKWKDIKREKAAERARKASIDLDETGDGVIVSESEANEMIANVRSRSSSESSSYSSHSSASSTDTSLCDENERISDSESELPGDELKESSHLETSANNVKTHIIPLDEKTTAISDFIHSAAGEPLRTYIDAFQTKANQPLHCDYMKTNDYKSQSSFNDTHLQLEISRSDSIELESKRSELLLRLSQNRNDDISKDHDHIAPTTKSISPRNFTELSPVDISPCNFGHNQMLLSLDSGFKSPLISKSVEPKIRPPDIIDSLTMYPNFVPDIDLSEKSISDIESPSRSPGAESIVISEDEPPIPLKIDKYFEHSPDFFGARITITNSTNSDIPSRRPTKRQSRLPKKPDSLTLQGTYKEKPLSKNEGDRASSLPHSTSTNFEVETSPIKTQIEIENELKELSKMQESPQFLELRSPMEFNKAISPKEFVISSGRKNSERALQIIQENSKILNRILTKQNILDTPKTGTKVPCESKRIYNDVEKFSGAPNEKYLDNRIIDSPLLKESTSDSLIGYCKRIGTSQSSTERNEFTRIRPISLDDPFSLESRSIYNVKTDGPNAKTGKSPNSERLENKTDIYGWENKGFMAKCGFESHFTRTEQDSDYKTENKGNFLSTSGRSNVDLKQPYISEWMNEEYLSEERKSSVTLPSSDVKDIPSYEKRITSDDYSYSFSSKYNDFVLSKASDICSKTVDRGPKVCENVSITDSSQLSDFAHVVTSSISFTYEPSVEDDFLTGAKSNSSDTLCQITSLDQVSTPISPKVFPTRETPTFPKESLEKNDRMKYESDDTCSAITSLIESDTLSSLSYPRSPSTGSYHPFPARPAIRMPKELGIRLGMYPRDSLNSPSK